MALAKKAGLSKQRLSQLLDPRQSFGDNAARNLEDRLGLPTGWFDALDERTQRFATQFEALPEELKVKWERLAAMLAEGSDTPADPR